MLGRTRLASCALMALALAMPPRVASAGPVESQPEPGDADPVDASDEGGLEDPSEPAAVPESEPAAVAESEPAAVAESEPAAEVDAETKGEGEPAQGSEAPSTAELASVPKVVAEPREPTDYGPVPLAASDAAMDASADLELRMSRARGWRNAGIAGLSVGGVLIISGALMLQSDEANPKLGNSNFTDARDRAGFTILAPGLLLAAGGAAMLTVGVLQAKKLRMSATADRDSAYVSLSGRF